MCDKYCSAQGKQQSGAYATYANRVLVDGAIKEQRLNPDANINKQEAVSEYYIETTSLRDSLGVRTQDPNIKSVVLYQLS